MSAGPSGKISLALGGSKKPGRPAPTNGVKRSHAALQDGEEEDSAHGKAQAVSHFDQSAGGAVDEKNTPKSKAPLVIAPQANRDWREASQRKRQRNGKAGGPQTHQNGEADVEARIEAAKPSYGLNILKKTDSEAEAQTNGHDQDTERMDEGMSDANGDAPPQERTADDEAMDALLGRSTKKDLVVPMTEEEAFDRDVRDAPDMATLDDYARVPVEEFGAAMLRGMGWDGNAIGTGNNTKKNEPTKIPERRPALLGIGAKPEAAVAQEMGTWGKAAKDKKGPIQVYNPVLLRDKKTGELYTEKELEEKKASDEKRKYELEFKERDEKHREKERRRRDRSDSRDRDRDRDRRDRNSRRDEKDRDDRHTRRYDDDDEYYRKKDKDRRRRDREYDDSRARSKRYDDDRSRHRHEDRHRDRRR